MTRRLAGLLFWSAGACSRFPCAKLASRSGASKLAPRKSGSKLPHSIKAVAPLVLLLSLAGCGGKLPQTHFYTLETSLPAPPPAATLPVDIAVARFRAPQALTQDRVVYRPAPHHMDFYEYHRWVDSPPDLVTQNLIAHLKRAGIFRSVTGIQGAASADYLLRGRIEHLEEVDADSSVSARVALSAELVDSKTRGVVWAGRGAHEVAVPDRSVEGVVRGMNEALRESLDQITRGLTTHFQQRPSR